eukprot:COSAG01_NODE_33896_length_556_cov_9.148796_1_plen_50_part_10
MVIGHADPGYLCGAAIWSRCDTLARVSHRANVGGCAAMTMLSDSNLKCHI